MSLRILHYYSLLSFFIMNSSYAQSNFKVTFIIKSLPDSHQNSDIFITGNFNNWQPNECLIKSGNEITLDNIKEGVLEYKFTRGDWHTLECTKTGVLGPPRQVDINKDTTIHITIAGWRDDFPSSTASPQVHLLDSSFYIPQLDTHRSIWIYLPEDYHRNEQRYPVLYMHDGQHLFDEATSQGRIGPLEWRVDETIDAHKYSAIVVAVAHADDKTVRQNEYFFSPNSNFPSPKGSQYLDFIVNTLKPYIDKKYRTLSDKEHTAMAGSSVAGLLTLYAGLHYPRIFGSLGIFSPSIWLDEGQVQKTIMKMENNADILTQKYYFYGGGNENRKKPGGSTVKMSKDVLFISDLLKNKSHPEIEVSIYAQGKHGAWYWSKAFPAFYDWWQRNLQQINNK